MHFNNLEQLREYCRDDVAFEHLKQTLTTVAACKVERQKALSRVVTRIRESLNLDTIFTTTAVEVRQLLHADRVGVFRFYPGSGWNDGEFISEDVLPEFHSALDAKIHDRCFGEQHAIHYQNGRIQAISDIYAAGIADCHINILRRFQIRANLVVPLLRGQYLWGLLCIHQCSAPRQWQPDEIEFVSHIATHLGIALQQAELLDQTQRQAVELSRALRDLKKSQMQLIQQEKLSSLGELVTGVAHEINNPVNFIYGNLTHAHQYAKDLLDLLSLYHQTYPQNEPDLANQLATLDLNFLMEDFPRMLSSMQVGVDRIRQIVLSLSYFSHVDESEMQSVDIHKGIDSALLILQHRLKSRSTPDGIRVVKEYGQLPPIDCYAGQLNQVFMNILSNAIDALEDLQETDFTDLAEPRQQITLCTGLISDLQTGTARVIIRIADNGSGMTQSVQRRLFEPFFTTKPVGKGTGLGLSISRQIIVEQHGGVLECYSQPGEGTEFWIELPVQRTHTPKMEVGCTIEA